MSQIKHIRDIKESEKTKISLVFYEGCMGPCVLKICKDRDVSGVYQVLMEVRHPDLAMVYDCVYANGNTYVLEEYITGNTLAEILVEKGTFSEKETAQLMTELCEGLAVLHHHEPPIIHNDIKTSNIMIREDGSVKLFDFDISRTYKEGSYKNTKLMGTHEYAAPEHYGFGQSEPCTDIYSLGVTMHEMLTGTGLDHEHNVTYQGGMAKIIQKCVEIDRRKRYVTADLLKADLEKFQKMDGFVWIIRAAGICAVLLLTVGGVLLGDHLRKEKNPQEFVETQESNLQEESNSQKETETANNADKEEETVTEEIGDTEDIQEEVTEEMEDVESVENMQGSVANPSGGDNAGGMGSSETEKEETNIPKQSMKVVYEIEDTFLAMNAWSDGTYVLMEEKSGAYFLRRSDGKEKHLEDERAALGAQMEYNPYRDQMYLILFDYDVNYVYELSKTLELKLVYEEEISMKDGAFLAFFSDGTLVYDYIRRNADDWSGIEGIASCPSTFVIADTVYSFQFVMNGSQLLYRFLEMDEAGKVVNDFPLEDEGIIFKDSQNRNPIYNNSEEVYFIGNKAGKNYVFCFDGKEYIPIKCLNDYADYIPYGYEELCVTGKGFRCYSTAHKAIVEFAFE